MTAGQARRAKQKAAPVAMAAAALAAFTALWFVDPSTHRVPLCPLHGITGLWCPFCGCTRASHALIHAQPGTALHDNALFVAALPVLAVFCWRWFSSSDPEPAARPLPRAMVWAGFALLLAFGVLRNLPQGRWLAPPT